MDGSLHTRWPHHEDVGNLRFCRLLCLLLILWPWGRSSLVLATSSPVHILLASHLQEITIGGQQLTKKLFVSKIKEETPGEHEIRFLCRFPKWQKTQPMVLALVSAGDQILKWSGRRYKGDFLIIGPTPNGCYLVHRSELEDYLMTLLPAEMNGRWPIEALKAQAVVARSYALYKIRTRHWQKNLGIHKFWDLENSEKDQVNLSLGSVTALTRQAVLDTQGEILVSQKHRPLPIFFHSKCGGQTLRPDDVWSEKIEGATRVLCPYCQNHGHLDWNFEMSLSSFESLLRKKLLLTTGERLMPNFSLVQNDFNQHEIEVNLSPSRSFKLKKSEFRRYLGTDQLMSNNIVVKRADEKLLIYGKGQGHGVGLCQYGAYEMAKKQMNYRQILSHYFPQYLIESVEHGKKKQ